MTTILWIFCSTTIVLMMMQDLLRADAAAADNHGDDDTDNDAEDVADYDDDDQGAGDLQAAEASPGHRAAAPRRAGGNLLQIQVTTSPQEVVTC